MDQVAVADLPLRDTTVLVVGAGPTGLMAALVLAARGIPHVVVDPKAGPTRESRAVVVQARTMEVYDQLGLAERVLRDSHPAVRFEVGGADAGIEVAAWQRGATRFPGFRIFEQSRNESVLVEALDERGSTVDWGTRLVELRRDGDGVEALVEGAGGLSRVRARWCVGADGATSPVRRGLDVPFEGVTDDATFWVADVRGAKGVPDDAISIQFGAHTFGVTFPMGAGGHVRLISLAQRAGIGQDEALSSLAGLGISYDAVEWFSTYRVHHRVAARFRVGPVFLAGDAAHVHSPVGGQGMNTGLQDAHDLALLLADVADGRLGEEALDRYGTERRPVARHLVSVTDRAFGLVGRPGRVVATARRAVGAVVGRVAPRVAGGGDGRVGRRITGYLGQYRIRYHLADRATDVAVRRDDPAVGLRLPPVEGNDEPLRHLTWQVHTYGAERVDALPSGLDGPFAFDPSPPLRRDRAYLVRPDGFVAASLPVSSGALEPTALADAVRRLHLRVG